MYKILSKQTSGIFTDVLKIPIKKNRVKHFYPTNFYGVVEVIDSTSRNSLLVKFMEDGSTRTVSLPNLIKGKCKNQSVKKRTSVPISTYFDDKIYKNKSDCEFRILSRLGTKCKIKFLVTGLESEVFIANAIKGKVTDFMSPSVYGVGYLGANTDLSVKHLKEYTLWHNMLKRAYCKEDKKGYYGKVFVDERWHNFSNFLNDLPALKNYDKWVTGQSFKDEPAYNLDKDFAYFGCKVYSRETCQFILESLNKGTTSRTYNSKQRITDYKEGSNV